MRPCVILAFFLVNDIRSLQQPEPTAITVQWQHPLSKWPTSVCMHAMAKSSHDCFSETRLWGFLDSESVRKGYFLGGRWKGQSFGLGVGVKVRGLFVTRIRRMWIKFEDRYWNWNVARYRVQDQTSCFEWLDETDFAHFLDGFCYFGEVR